MTPLAATQHWLERAVIGLGLCPFAAAVHTGGRVRWVSSDADTPTGLLADLLRELELLAEAAPTAIDTTLLVHPHALADFDAYNDFLDVADAAVDQLDLTGVIQIASFHPRYRFEGSGEEDPANCSNRSPHPMLQLLREDSVERALAACAAPAHIYERNIRTLRALGHDGWQRLLAGDVAV